jgi:transmembrane sensor
VTARQNIPAEIEDEASRWVIERDAGLSPEAARELDAWLAADPAHRLALARAEDMWRAMGSAPIVSAINQRRTVHPPLAGYPPIGREKPRRPWFAPAVAASLALVAIGATRDWPTWLRADAMTETGERRNLALGDGSIVQLNTDSAIAIDYRDDRRIVHLLKGEAAFTVSADARSPFVVEAGDGSATALGTQFIVRRAGTNTQVTVTEHSVRVSTAPDQAVGSVVVAEGQSVHYGNGSVSRPQRIDADAAAAWTRGRLVFVDRPLREVVGELARYHKGYIGVLGDALGDRRVSGVFRTDDPIAALDTLQRSLGIGSTRITDRLILIHA